MKKVLFVIALIVVAVALTGAGKHTYIGSAKCKMCHNSPAKGDVFKKWTNSLHAKSMDSLKAKGEDKNPACLGCHTTAFNAGGYAIGAANAADFANVGCEVCHGPGSDYKAMSVMKDRKLSLAAGMVIPNEATCKSCHNPKSPTFKGFNYQEASKKIDHSYIKR